MQKDASEEEQKSALQVAIYGEEPSGEQKAPKPETPKTPKEIAEQAFAELQNATRRTNAAAKAANHIHQELEGMQKRLEEKGEKLRQAQEHARELIATVDKAHLEFQRAQRAHQEFLEKRVAEGASLDRGDGQPQLGGAGGGTQPSRRRRRDETGSAEDDPVANAAWREAQRAVEGLLNGATPEQQEAIRLAAQKVSQAARKHAPQEPRPSTDDINTMEWEDDAAAAGHTAGAGRVDAIFAQSEIAELEVQARLAKQAAAIAASTAAALPSFPPSFDAPVCS